MPTKAKLEEENGELRKKLAKASANAGDKFRLTDTTIEIEVEGRKIKLYQIEAVRDVFPSGGGHIRPGWRGGFVAHEANLKQYGGDAWIGPDAIVYGGAIVEGNAYISSFTRIYGGAHVGGDAYIGGGDISGSETVINGNVYISSGYNKKRILRIVDTGEADPIVILRSVVIRDAKITDRVKIKTLPGSTQIQIHPGTILKGDCVIGDDCIIGDDCVIDDDPFQVTRTVVSGSAVIYHKRLRGGRWYSDDRNALIKNLEDLDEPPFSPFKEPTLLLPYTKTEPAPVV